MSYSIDKIVEDVEICMDEIADNDAEFDVTETNTQDDTERATIIKSKIREALCFVLAHADATLLEPSEVITTATVVAGTVSKSLVTLPPEYIRLVYARCTDWSRFLGQDDIIVWDDPQYPMLSDAYVGATADRPAVAMIWNGTTRILELYPSGTVSVGIMTDPGDISDTEEDIDVPERCYRAFIYYIAGLVYVTYADQTRSTMMFNQANDIIGFTTAAASAQAQLQQQNEN